MSYEIKVTDDRDACFALRVEVFVDEQGVPKEIEIDEHEDDAVHILATFNGEPVGTSRLLFKGETGKIGRFCVVKSQRGTGLGLMLLEASIKELQTYDHLTRAYLSAQTYAVPFYAKGGFVAYGDEYMEAGIPHMDMERDL